MAPPPAEGVSLSTAHAALAGAVAAGTGLATTELVGALVDRRKPSVIGAVSSRLVNALSGPLRAPAVRVFGVHDKAALLVGVVLVCIASGAALGALAPRWRAAPVAGYIVFASAGMAIGSSDPLASSAALAVATAAGVVAGLTVFREMSRLAGTAPPPSDDGRARTFDRRAFLVGGTGFGATAALAALAGHWWRATERTRPSAVLPAPRSTVAEPGAQPFSVDGLPPYVTPAGDFYRIDTAIFVPRVDTAGWRLTIDGLVGHPVTWSYADLLAMDLVEEPVTLACVSNDVGGSLVGNARWLGVPLRSLLARASVLPEATQIVGRSVDDFTVGFPSELLDDGRTAMVAVGMNGAPLPAEHGFPARLIVAGLYGYVSATKWLRRIELTRLEDYDAYWVQRGWAKDGPIKTESRVDVPRSGASVPSGTVRIAGVAWAPTRGISRVEVQVDKGQWVDARLGATASANTWVQWLYEWPNASPGDHVVAVRATDGDGVLQTELPTTPRPSGATGYHYRGFSVA